MCQAYLAEDCKGRNGLVQDNAENKQGKGHNSNKPILDIYSCMMVFRVLTSLVPFEFIPKKRTTIFRVGRME